MHSPLTNLSTGPVSLEGSCPFPVISARAIGVPATRFRCLWLDSREQLEAWQPDWKQLADRAIHRNFSMEPNFLIPAMAHLNNEGARVLAVTTVADQETGRPARLCGLMPLVSRRFYGLPIACLEIWKHPQSFDSTPLLDSDCAAGALESMLRFLREQGIGLVSWDTVSAEGEFAGVFLGVLAHLSSHTFQRDSFTRACLRPEADAETYVARHVSKNIRRNSPRMRRRLEEQGTLTFDVSQSVADCEKLVEDFLRLEASGWKGDNGGALGCHPTTRAFFSDMVTASAKSNLLRILTLRLHDRPIAMQCEFHSETCGSAYKTAFDHQYASYSPGILLQLEGIAYQHRAGLAYLDSCTAPDNQTMNRMWGQRLAFQSLVTSLKPGVPSLAISVMPTIQRAAQRFRKWKRPGNSQTQAP